MTPALPLPPLPLLYGPPALEGGKEPEPGPPPPAGEGAAAAQPELLPARALHALLHRARRQPACPGAAAARRGPAAAAAAAALRVADRRGAARRPPPAAPGARRLGTSGPLPAPLPLRPAALAGAGPPGAARRSLLRDGVQAQGGRAARLPALQAAALRRRRARARRLPVPGGAAAARPARRRGGERRGHRRAERRGTARLAAASRAPGREGAGPGGGEGAGRRGGLRGAAGVPRRQLPGAAAAAHPGHQPAAALHPPQGGSGWGDGRASPLPEDLGRGCAAPGAPVSPGGLGAGGEPEEAGPVRGCLSAWLWGDGWGF